jgi:hypothetical protein
VSALGKTDGDTEGNTGEMEIEAEGVGTAETVLLLVVVADAIGAV